MIISSSKFILDIEILYYGFCIKEGLYYISGGSVPGTGFTVGSWQPVLLPMPVLWFYWYQIWFSVPFSCFFHIIQRPSYKLLTK